MTEIRGIRVMGKVERIVIYTLLAVLTVATFTDLGPTQAKDKPGEATFKKVTIVDEKGRARITLRVLPDGPFIDLYDQNGKYRMALGVGGNTGFSVYDQNEKLRMALGVASDGNPAIGLLDQNGKPRIGLDLDPDGSKDLTFYDQDKKKRMTLGMTSDGTPTLFLIDQNEKLRIGLGVNSDGNATIGLFDQNAKIRMGLGVHFDGNAAIGLIDQNGKLRAALGNTKLEVPATEATEERPESSLAFFDNKEKVIWKAP